MVDRFLAAHTHAPWEVPSVPIVKDVHGTLVLRDRDHAHFAAEQGWNYDFSAEGVGPILSGCQ